MSLPDGWRVVSAFDKSSTTGGYFSYGYVVERADGERAFLKALDLSDAMYESDFAAVIRDITTAFTFERDLLFACRDKNTSRVVKAIGEGTVTVPGALPPQVQYLLFELADGDMRAAMDAFEHFNLAWALRTLHHITTGLNQLHLLGIAHQDMKPSNVLSFKGAGVAKVADLGRASRREHAALHDGFNFAGAVSYAPPELRYGQVASEWNERRFACDAYHLGSIAMFIFSQTHMTASIFSKMQPAHLPEVWTGTYAEVLPRVQLAFNESILEFEDSVPAACRREVVEAVRQLCEPDPAHRGHPSIRNHRGNRYTLERYVSLFNQVAARAELGLLR